MICNSVSLCSVFCIWPTRFQIAGQMWNSGYKIWNTGILNSKSWRKQFRFCPDRSGTSRFFKPTALPNGPAQYLRHHHFAKKKTSPLSSICASEILYQWRPPAPAGRRPLKPSCPEKRPGEAGSKEDDGAHWRSPCSFWPRLRPPLPPASPPNTGTCTS